MEDLWKDVPLPTTTTPSLPPTTTTSTTTSSCSSGLSIQDFLGHPHTAQTMNFALCFSPCPTTAAAPASAAECWSKKRTRGGHHEAEGGVANRRQARMIKNRESAARSRARKQAYTRELEQKIGQLAEENARLKREHDQFLSTNVAMATQVPKISAFRRASTAPL